MTDSTFRAADLAGAGDALRAGGERVPTWITKEAGNRRLPFDAERLQRSIDAVHAEFPQLDVSDYRRVVQAMVERKPSISADDLVDLLIREAESRVDLVAPEWGTVRRAHLPASPVQACQPQPLLRCQPEVRLLRGPAGKPRRSWHLQQRHPALLFQGRAAAGR